MTREEAKKKAEIMMAYAEGKEIEFFNGTTWIKASMPEFKWGIVDYRIKQEPTYRPFKNKDECWAEMQKHQPFGWIYEKLSTAYININGIDSVCVCCNEDATEYKEAFEQFTFADGTPFGIKEDE